MWSSASSDPARRCRLLAAVAMASLLAFACAGSGALSRDTKARIHVRTGDALLGKGKLGEALHEYEMARKEDPDNPAVYHGRGLVFMTQGRLAEAVAEFRRSLELDNRQPLVLNNLSHAYLQLGDHAQAIKHAERALADSEFAYPAAAHFNIGMALAQQGDVAGATAHFNKALETYPRFDRAHFQLGLFAEREGRLADALACFRKAVEANRHYVLAYYHLGMAYLKQGNRERAREQFARVRELVPADAEESAAELRRDAGRMLSLLEK